MDYWKCPECSTINEEDTLRCICDREIERSQVARYKLAKTIIERKLPKQKKNQKYSLKQRLKFILLSIPFLFIGLSISVTCFQGIIDEYNGKTQHVPPFDALYKLLLLAVVIIGIGLIVVGFLLIIHPRTAFKIIDSF